MGLFTNKYAHYSEEQLRNLKVDIKKIPIWENNLKELKDKFSDFDSFSIKASIDLIIEANNVVGLGIGSEDISLAREWRKEITSDKLVWSSQDYNAPRFIRLGLDVDFSSKINSSISHAIAAISEIEKKGVSNSLILRLATNKVDPSRLEQARSALDYYKAYLPKTASIQRAIAIINKLRDTSEANLKKIISIEEKLKIARMKLSAIEKFEHKHGKAFAKAAAAEQQTRQRAASLKRMVSKTENCPYCDVKIGTDAHLDHIYPVSKGGLSIIENLVWCCADCNSKKSDKGLIQFLTEKNVPVTDAISRLQAMGKHV